MASIEALVTPLEKLAISAGVSYRDPPTPDQIAEMIRSGAIQPTFLVHITHILVEAPPQLWSMAAAAMEDPAQALRNIAAMRASLGDGIDSEWLSRLSEHTGRINVKLAHTASDLFRDSDVLFGSHSASESKKS